MDMCWLYPQWGPPTSSVWLHECEKLLLDASLRFRCEKLQLHEPITIWKQIFEVMPSRRFAKSRDAIIAREICF